MQKVAAYLLERPVGAIPPAGWRVVADEVGAQIDRWLLTKQGEGQGNSGEYVAEDQSRATWQRDSAEDGHRSWRLLRLDEVTAAGRKVSAIVSMTVTESGISVYVTLEVGAEFTSVRPVEVDTRCPRVVRDLLEFQGPWRHGASLLHGHRIARGIEGGVAIAEEIADEWRTIPTIVVSEQHGRQALPHLSERLAYDLTGLANVVRLDDDATWALTDSFGTKLSCFGGAVRIYWPGVTPSSDPFRHPLYTGARLAADVIEPKARLDQFRRQLRGLLMRASALSTVRPKVIDEIRAAASRRAFAEMMHAATSVKDYREIAESYAKDNDALRAEADDLRESNCELLSRVAQLEGECSALNGRVRKAEARTRELEDEVAAEGEAGEDDIPDIPPKGGEVRYYKKRHAAPGHDIMVRIQDCGHDNWQGAHRADKARKGIAKLERKDDWRSMKHCASCQGGGVWRVEW